MDDLNDLVWTSPPSKPTLPSSNSRTGSPFSAFDQLANTSNRSYSPALSSSSFNAPASSSNLRPNPAAASPRPGASSDAFACLLSMGSSSASGGGSLSMAEKAAKLADETRRKQEADAKAFAGQGAFWDQFGGGSGGVAPLGAPVRAQGTGGSLAVPSAGMGPARISSPALVPSRPTSSASNNHSAYNPPVARSSTPLASSSNDLWSEFDTLSTPALTASASSIASKPPANQPSKATRNGAPVDSYDSFDMFEDLTVSSKPGLVPTSSRSTPNAERTPRTLTPGDHDFGSREDRDDDGWGTGERAGGLLAGNGSDDDDDFMGAFNRPPKPAPFRSPPPSSAQPSQATASSRRPPSPPPHILGQIVEMGFSLTQARNALASTPTGLDVQVALEMLLSESRSAPPSHGQISSTNGAHSDDEDDRARREEEEAAERRRRRRRGPTRDPATPAASTSSAAASGSSTPLDGLSAAQIQDQASKLLAQTNLLGQSMFNRANAFWKEGKTQVQKAYEERQAAGGAAGGSGTAGGKPAIDGRPKWMVDAEAFEIEEREAAGGGSGSCSGGFRDGEDDDKSPRSTNGRTTTKRATSPPRQQQQQRSRDPPAAPAPAMSAAAKVASLFSDDSAPVSYVSLNRRRPGPSPPSNAASSSSSAPAPKPPAAAAPLRKRPHIPLPPSALSTSSSHRLKGNDQFKLGLFGEAESSYSLALSSLPSNHLLTLPVLNNRAAARLKNGDHNGCVADATAAIDLVGVDYDPAKEEALPEGEGGTGLGEALVKALQKRAGAYEAAEKWAKALGDWEMLGRLTVGGSVGKGSKIPAMDGARRCRKMVDLENGVTKPSAPATVPAASRPRPSKPTAPKPKPTPAPNSTDEGEALARVRASAALATSELDLRASLKDTVDARLSAWSKNKETNLRALLASLDTVLWPELGWVKCGMHELVTEKQVKVRYTRAIGKVHPDKLASLGAGATVEQRMVAQGVFGVLNEAWNASQA